VIKREGGEGGKRWGRGEGWGRIRGVEERVRIRGRGRGRARWWDKREGEGKSEMVG
jgi:hypothetical protein